MKILLNLLLASPKSPLGIAFAIIKSVERTVAIDLGHDHDPMPGPGSILFPGLGHVPVEPAETSVSTNHKFRAFLVLDWHNEAHGVVAVNLQCAKKRLLLLSFLAFMG